jgi:hypothetical protein
MYPQKTVELPPPPGVMGSLRAGFDAVSRHVALILLPMALDVLLWLGPRFSVDGLLAPFLNMLFDQTRLTLTSSAEVSRFTEFETLFNQTVEHFNVLSLLSRLQTFPIGVSSLLADMPVETPSAAGGTDRLFPVDYFKHYWWQSWILGLILPLGIRHNAGDVGNRTFPMGNHPDVDPLWCLADRSHDVFYTGHTRSYGSDDA